MDRQVSAFGGVFSVKRGKINHSRTIADQFDLSRQQKKHPRTVCAGVLSVSPEPK